MVQCLHFFIHQLIFLIQELTFPIIFLFTDYQMFYQFHTNGVQRRARRYPAKEIARNENLEYLCPQCGRNFIRLDSLRNHLYKDCQKIRFECKMCPKSFKRKYVLKQHLRSIHFILNDTDSFIETGFTEGFTGS